MLLNRRTLLAMLPAGLLAAPLGADTGPVIVATTGMIADAARRIGGGAVRALMGPGMDPHGYRQTRSDIAALARADLVLWHGLYLEAQMEDFLNGLSRSRRVVAVAEALPREVLRGNPQYPDRFDPHVWMDPTLWAQVVPVVEAALTEAMPGRAAAHAAAAAAFIAEIGALDTYARDVLGTVPASSRVLVTAHDAFGYFGRAYGFEVEGIQGLSTESEAGLARVGELVDLLVARKVPAVFVESSVSDRSIRALVEGAQARGHAVSVGGELFSDAMGKDGTYEGTYLGMIDHNVTLIARALDGSAPAGGMSGLLAGV
ncbi:zinc ABC transporter substrate-binding protein [Paracoccaceae bacterium Fryx2]|nr:zinc ABC transporter substrate-binding protein [Paracoccaceae bacterium Fryx2]